MQDFSEATALPEASILSLPSTAPGIPRLKVPKPLAMRACRRFIWNSFILEAPLFRVTEFDFCVIAEIVVMANEKQSEFRIPCEIVPCGRLTLVEIENKRGRSFYLVKSLIKARYFECSDKAVSLSRKTQSNIGLSTFFALWRGSC